MTARSWFAASGRWIIALMFLAAGIGKIAAPEPTEHMIAAVGLPFPPLSYLGALLAELGCGTLLLLGFQTRLASLALAFFTLVASLYFHAHFGDQTQTMLFIKDIAIIGGLLQIAAFGGGRIALDNIRRRPGGATEQTA